MNSKYMDLAYEEALKAFELEEVPVGCVIVKDDEILACTHNLKEKNNNSLDHAELLAIKEVSSKLNNWRLDDCDIYITLSPCPMCASAIKQARIKNVYSALNNLDNNNFEIISQIFKKDKVNPSVNFVTNLDSEVSKKILNSFFKKQRNS